MASSQETLVVEGKKKTGDQTPPLREATVNPLLRRIHGWSWQAFPIGMGTGAVFVCLSDVESDPGHPLTTIGTVFFFLNLIFFCINSLTLLLQLILYPRHARELITDPSRDIYVPLMVLSYATIVIGLVIYGVPSGHVTPTAVICLFWIYVALSLVVCLPILMIWYNQPHDIKKFSPAWAFLIFPMMLTGVVAYNVLKKVDPSDPRALGILLAGYIFQGLGFFMTLFYICIYILRLMTTGFMDGPQASGAFVACGPPGFTAIALINLADHARDILPAQNILLPDSGDVWYAASIVCALFLFGLAVFFFLFGALPYWFKLKAHLSEILGCWALTFPNVGWILTLRKIGDIFHLRAFTVWHTVMVVYMCVAWIVLIGFTAVAFWKGMIFNASSEEVIRDSEKSAITEGSIDKVLFKNQCVAVSVIPVNVAAQDPPLQDASNMV